MKFTIVKEPIPYLYIEDTYTREEQSLIHQEIDFLCPKLAPGETTGSAFYPDTKEAKKKNKGVFLDNVYTSRDYSYILTLNRKLYNEEVYSQLLECSPIYGLLRHCLTDHTLLSYYEDSHHYKTHTDQFIISSITWFYKEPKNFTGGDFIFTDYNITIPVKNNATVMFFSCFKHEVNEVSIIDNKVPYSGRFSISNFLSHKINTIYDN